MSTMARLVTTVKTYPCTKENLLGLVFRQPAQHIGAGVADAGHRRLGGPQAICCGAQYGRDSIALRRGLVCPQLDSLQRYARDQIGSFDLHILDIANKLLG